MTNPTKEMMQELEQVLQEAAERDWDLLINDPMINEFTGEYLTYAELTGGY